MHLRRLRDLLGRNAAAEGRVFWSALWFQRHNNARYAELMPRLERLDAFRVTCAEARVLRGIEYRLYRGRPGSLGQRLLLPRAAKLYRGMLCTEFRQLEHFPGPAVVDVDDPYFGEKEIALFRRPNVVALVTLASWAADEYRSRGVSAPIHVIPQGVNLSSLTSDRVHEAATRRQNGDFVLGYTAALLSTSKDGADPMYAIDHLLELWREIRARLPNASLWLIGEATARARQRCQASEGVILIGRVERDLVLSHVANFDLALYPRRTAGGIQAVKIAEYIGAGVPTIAYNYPVANILAETHAGVLVGSSGEFIEVVDRLARDGSARRELAHAARAARHALDWETLSRRYEREVLDRYLA